MSSGPAATIALLGFGLIGGSIAHALSRDPRSGAVVARPRITAWTPSGRGPARAAADGVIDRSAVSPADALDGADLVVIAAPPLDAIAILGRLGSDLRSSVSRMAVITDVSSTKGAVMAAAAAADVRFIGGHPMAGRESSGYEAAGGDLFIERPWVIVRPDGASDDDVAMVRWLIGRCGARAVEMSAAAHDAATASISHLPLVAAAALVESVHGRGAAAWSVATSLAATGWAGATRLALGDPRMGAGILATNGPEVAEGLRAFRQALDAWLAVLDQPGGPDPEMLEERLATARASLLKADDTGT